MSVESGRPESLLSILKSVAEFGLMVCGIIGIAVQIFHDQGWLKKLLQKLMDGLTASSMIEIGVIVVVLFFGKRWYDRTFEKAENANALGNFLMKTMMALGAYFLYLVITTGSFKM